MGACTGKSKAQQPQTQTVQVGGGENGKVQWLFLKGAQVQNPPYQTGWEMNFQVDSQQKVSGGNTNGCKDATMKQYTGTFRDGILDVNCTFDDGAQIKYEGKIENGTMNVKCTVIQAGTTNNFSIGDIAQANGPLKYI